jgi:hypothetical protein
MLSHNAQILTREAVSRAATGSRQCRIVWVGLVVYKSTQFVRANTNTYLFSTTVLFLVLYHRSLVTVCAAASLLCATHIHNTEPIPRTTSNVVLDSLHIIYTRAGMRIRFQVVVSIITTLMWSSRSHRRYPAHPRQTERRLLARTDCQRQCRCDSRHGLYANGDGWYSHAR